MDLYLIEKKINCAFILDLYLWMTHYYYYTNEKKEIQTLKEHQSFFQTHYLHTGQ